MTFSIPKIKHEYALLPSEREAFQIKPRPLPSEWADGKLLLVAGGYDTPGVLHLKPYQVEPVDAITKCRRVLFCGATRTFKSGMTDIAALWAMRFLGINGVIAYAENDTARLVFKTRLRKMITDNPELRELWDGNEDNLTIENLLLRGSFWRIASAQNIHDLSTFGAGFVIGSEVAKWEGMAFNPVDELYDRQGAYSGDLRKSIMESSPYEVGDYLYQEMYKDGVIIFVPMVPCPACGEYQELRDYIPNPDGSVKEYCIKLAQTADELATSEQYLRSASRIRFEREAAVKYECYFCRQEIRERDRYDISKRVKWVAPEIFEGDNFRQAPEKILKDGTIIDIEHRERYDTWCYQWNRLVDINFPFYECLARFFESYHNHEKKKVYDNNDMARFSRKKTGRAEISSFEKKKRPYYQAGPFAGVPDGVLVVTAGIDAQDKSFYYVIQGWGEGMASWILRFGNIECPMVEQESMPRDEMYEKFAKGFLNDPLKGRDGKIHSIRCGFIDRGGHRPKDVDFIVSKIGFLHAYIGLTRVDPKRELIYKSEQGNFFLGQSETLSEYVGLLMDTDMWYVPQDVTHEFVRQATAHYFIKKKNADGNTRTIWIKDVPDHYRSCLNLSYAAAKALNLDVALFNEKVVDALHKKSETERPREEAGRGHPPRHGYFDRALGIR